MKLDSQIALKKLTLENHSVRLQLLPEVGSKITSLIYVPDGREFLFQPPDPLQPYRIPGYGSEFKDFDNSGFDECLPTVSACRYPDLSFRADLPDHGDVWAVPWEWEASENHVKLQCNCRQLPLIFYKEIRLQHETVQISYKVENTSARQVHYLWSSHALLLVHPGDKIKVPSEVKEVFIDQSHTGRLGKFGDRTSWPLAVDLHGMAADLSTLLPPDANTAEKYFTPRLSEGWCALYSPSTNHSISFRFNPKIIPFVGMWINQGGWPTTSAQKHYTVALEPCSGAPDSLEKAIEFNQASVLAGRESRMWQLEIQIRPGPPRL